MSAKSNTGGKTNGNIVAIIAMFFLFAMISFVTNLAAPIGTIWGYQFEGNSFLGMLGNMMNFLAYLFMGIPAGKIITRIGYKKTALWAMAIGIVGLLVQWTSSLGTMGIGMFVIYLIGAFICGFCVCMLNTVTNPMLNLLGGGGNRGNQLLQAGGAFNSLAGTLTPFFVGALIGQLSRESHIGNVSPLLWIAIGIFVVAFIVISFVHIPEPNLVKGGSKAPKYSHSPWNFRHTVLGVCAIFMYVGIEVGIPSTLNFYLAEPGEKGAGIIGDASVIAGAIVAVYWLFMLIGRTLSTFISSKVSSRQQLITVSFAAIVLIIVAILTPKEVVFNVPSFIYHNDSGVIAQVPVSALFLICCGLCTSVMWGGIFNLAVEGLGKYTAQASGIFMMMVVGGGVIPLVQQLFADKIGYMPSYWLLVACLGFILFYAIAGCINVNKDIDVSYEEELKEELV